jgi:hypothetical protein
MTWTSSWTTGALVALVAGCAHQVKDDEARLGQLSMDQKHDLFTAQHNVAVAQANLDAARRARTHARTFKEISDEELNSAKHRAEAARGTVKLSHNTGETAALDPEQRSLDIANRQVIAARAKLDFADHLGDVRKAEEGLAADQLEAARREVRVVRAETLRRNGVEPGEDLSVLVRDRDNQHNQVAMDERRVARLRDEAGRLHVAWEERRRDYNVAAREMPTMPPAREPRAPEKLRPTPLPGDVVNPPLAPPAQTAPEGGRTM